MITTILFDMDDTLLDFSRSERCAIEDALKSVGINADERVFKRYSEINDSLWKRLEKQEITRAEVLIKRFEQLFEEYGIDADAQDMQSRYMAAISRYHFYLPDAQELLEYLQGKYKMYIVSNGTLEVQKQRIKDSGIAKYFNGIFISQELGFNKPDKRFFDAIPGLDKRSSVIIGDSLTSDIQGGINAGIHTVWFNPSGKQNNTDIKPDFVLRTLLPKDLTYILELVNNLEIKVLYN